MGNGYPHLLSFRCLAPRPVVMIEQSIRESVGMFKSWGPDRALPFGWGHSSGSSYSSLCHKAQSRAWQRLDEETHWKRGLLTGAEHSLVRKTNARAKPNEKEVCFPCLIALHAIWSGEIWERSNPRKSGNKKLFGSVEKLPCLPILYRKIWKQAS